MGEMKTRQPRILYVAYPLLPVSENSCGGAEQVLLTLEREAVLNGWTTTVAACAGSKATGSVYATVAPANGWLKGAEGLEARHCKEVLELVYVRAAVGRGFDLIHDHSGSFFHFAHELDIPVLATLHLPRMLYPQSYFHKLAKNVFFNCVSKAQSQSFRDLSRIEVVANGIPVEHFALRERKQDYVLWMGRICEEKGAHVALDVAAEAKLPIVIAGGVYPFEYHRNYFEREVRPRLKRMTNQTRFVDSPGFGTKLELLRGAKAVLLTSQVDETSSLVGMEAAACGTPVIAFKRGALPEMVEHNITGFLVNNQKQMLDAIENIGAIKPRICREYAVKNFSAARMFAGYDRLYQAIMQPAQIPTPALAA